MTQEKYELKMSQLNSLLNQAIEQNKPMMVLSIRNIIILLERGFKSQKGSV